MKRLLIVTMLVAVVGFGPAACSGGEEAGATTSGPKATVAQTTSTTVATPTTPPVAPDMDDPALESYRVAVKAWQTEWGPKLTEWYVVFAALNDPTGVTESQWEEMARLIEVAGESYAAFGEIEPPAYLADAHDTCRRGMQEVLRICGLMTQGLKNKDESLIQEAYAERELMEDAMASVEEAAAVLEEALGFPLSAGPGS